MGISYLSATTKVKTGRKEIGYSQITPSVINDHLIIVNTTPLGMFPNVYTCPEIPYDLITPDHILYDLVYNPEETLFLKKGKEQGAKTKNGLEMLHLQALRAWEIWNS
jgi:shikimate dehydrogenase